MIVYGLIDDKTSPFSHNSSVELKSEVDQRTLSVAKVDAIPNVFENQTIARLAAKALILELQHAKTSASMVGGTQPGSTQTRFQHLLTANEGAVKETPDERTSKQRIIDLSLKYNILSPHTAFVGVEKRTDGNNAQMVLREVPIRISSDKDENSPARNYYCQHDIQSFCMSYEENHEDEEDDSPASYDLDRGTIDFCGMDHVNNECDEEDDSPWSNDDHEDVVMSYSADNAKDENSIPAQQEETWPLNDEDIIRHLITKQNFDGLWQADSEIIVKLTGKPLASFELTHSHVDSKVLASVIIVLILETRYAAFSSLWHGIVQKARKKISAVLGTDSKTFDQLQGDIRLQG